MNEQETDDKVDNELKQADDDEKCQYCANHTIHPMWCYLIVADNETMDNTKSNGTSGKNNNKNSKNQATYVGMSRQPLHRLKSHNREPGYKFGSKTTRPLAGHWKMKMIVGGWTTNGALNFKRQWKQVNRNVNSRVEFGKTGAKKYKLDVYLF